MQDVYDNIAEAILNFYLQIARIFQPMGIPFGRYAWMMVSIVGPLLLIIFLLFRRLRSGSSALPDGVRRIIASTGDVSAGIVGTRKIQFVRNPQDALVFLKIEENAVQQALTAVDYYVQQGEIEESMKEKLVNLYQSRLQALQQAISSSAELREVIDSSTAVDKARSDYLRKLEAMSGTAVEADSTEAGPSSVGMPDSTPTQAPTTGPPGGAAPSGGPPGGAAPSGGPPGGAAPSGAAPGGGPPGGAAPGGAAPGGGPPGGAAPSGAAPGGAPGGTPSGPPGGAPDSGGPPGGAAATPTTSGGKSTLQSEMLAEMERLRALMSGD